MAIKIECVQCGYMNDLGRVFCNQCSKKLDLKRTAPDDLEDRREVQYGSVIRKGVGGLLAIAVIGGLALGFWPVKVPAVQRDAAGGQSVEVKTHAVKQALMAGRAASVDFTEGEFNGLVSDRARPRRLKAMAVDIRPGAMDVSAWFSWRPNVITNLTFLPKNKVTVPVSMEMTVIFNDGVIKITSGRVGHLPLVGPMMSLPKKFFSAIFSDVIAEKQLVGSLTEVVFDQDVAHVKFGK